MADFKAKNTTRGARELFEHRKEYRDNAMFEEGRFVSGVEDFFISKQLSFYGRIDSEDNFISPIASRTAAFKTKTISSNAPRALDFVVDAYKGFMREFQDLINSGICGVTASDINLEVVRAWTRFEDLQKAAFMSFSGNLEKHVLAATLEASYQKKKNDLVTIEQFMEKVTEFTKLVSGKVPLTATAVMASRFCSLQSSGLAIILEDSAFDDDEKKSIFMDKKIFDFYRQAAMKHGFMIDRNAPWQIVANIDSDPMAEYMKNRFTSKEELANTHYYKIYYKDIGLLKKFILMTWNSFVDNNRYASHHDHDSGTPIFYKRERLNLAQLNDKYDNAFWIRYYCKIKQSELQNKGIFNDIFVKNLIKNAIHIEKNIDMPAALDYINKQFSYHVIRDRLDPIRFLPGEQKLEVGEESEFQSNVILETTDYY